APEPGGRPGGLHAREEKGIVHLSWNEATDNEAVYGYEILRSEDGGEPEHVHSVRSTTWTDRDVVAGVRYRYVVRAYDLAGNRSADSAPAEIELARLVGVPEGAA